MTEEIQNAGDAGNIARTIANIVTEHMQPQVIELKGGPGDTPAQVMILPRGLEAKSAKPFLDPYRDRPERRAGTAGFDYLASFIDHANRFKDADSALFARRDPVKPSIQCVFDYHRAGGESDPRFGKHRGRHDFPLSDEWKAWDKANKAVMSQQVFAEFIEDRIADVIVPDEKLLGEIRDRDAGGDFGPKTPLEMLADYAKLIGGDFATPSRLVEMSRGLAVHANHKVEQALNLATGETQVQFAEEHSDGDGHKVKVPNLFLIAVPVFMAGDLYRIAGRLRYRLRGGEIVWFFELYRTDAVFDSAFAEACGKAAEETGLPLFYGAPEDGGA